MGRNRPFSSESLNQLPLQMWCCEQSGPRAGLKQMLPPRKGTKAMANQIDRRTYLRGVCALLGLPLLEAMRPRLFAGDPTSVATSPKPRLLFIDEIGNGVDNARWYPTKLGREWEITETLRPLEPFRDHITILSGLRQTHDDNGHLAADTFLTGAKATNNAVSVDQVAAEHLGRDVQFPSLVLGPGGTGTQKWAAYSFLRS